MDVYAVRLSSKTFFEVFHFIVVNACEYLPHYIGENYDFDSNFLEFVEKLKFNSCILFYHHFPDQYKIFMAVKWQKFSHVCHMTAILTPFGCHENFVQIGL